LFRSEFFFRTTREFVPNVPKWMWNGGIIGSKGKSCCNGVLHHFLRVRWLWMNRKMNGEAIYIRVSPWQVRELYIRKTADFPSNSGSVHFHVSWLFDFIFYQKPLYKSLHHSFFYSFITILSLPINIINY
jgi:hypothetical protein